MVAPAWVTAGQAGFAASVSPRDGVTYAWTATNGTITSGAATPAITFTPGAGGSATLTCTLTSGGGSAAGSATAVIVAAPATPTVVAPAYVTQGESGYAAAVAAQPGLVDLRLLTEQTGFRRNRRFRFAPDLELVEEPGWAEAAEGPAPRKPRLTERTRR